MKKTLLKTFYNLGAFAPFHRVNRRRLLILMYHRFSREKNPFKTSSEEFSAHLEYLSANNHVLSLTEAVDCLQNGKSLPPNAAVITVDDGYADAFEIAFPILKRFEMPATVYAVTDFLEGKCWLWTDLMRCVLFETEMNRLKIEFENDDYIETNLQDNAQKIETASRINSRLKKMPDEKKDLKIKEIAESLCVEIPVLPAKDYAPMSWEQAREMDAENVRIESHTATHPILTNINQTKLNYELQTSRCRLEIILNRKVENFCYPNGSINETVRRAVEENGYKCAVTTDYGFNETAANPFLLKRIDAPSAIENFAQSVSGFESARRKIGRATV